MNNVRKPGCIDAVQSAKSIDQLVAIGKKFGDFCYVSSKTIRRFERKFYARLAEFNSATK